MYSTRPSNPVQPVQTNVKVFILSGRPAQQWKSEGVPPAAAPHHADRASVCVAQRRGSLLDDQPDSRFPFSISCKKRRSDPGSSLRPLLFSYSHRDRLLSGGKSQPCMAVRPRLIAGRVRLGSKLRQKWHPHWQDNTIVGDRLLMVLALMAASLIDSPPLEAMTKKIAVTSLAGSLFCGW